MRWGNQISHAAKEHLKRKRPDIQIVGDNASPGVAAVGATPIPLITNWRHSGNRATPAPIFAATAMQ